VHIVKSHVNLEATSLIETVLEKITCDKCGETEQGRFERHLRKPDKALKFLERLYGGIMVLIWDYT
jgi:hypothetical protein